MSDFADLSTARLKALLESDDELEVSSEAGAVDDLEVLYLLRELRLAWEDEWGSFESSEVYERLVGSAKDEQLTRAVAHGHKPTLDRHVGSMENRVSATGYDRLLSKCSPAAHQILIKGVKGSGKTTKAFDIAKRLYDEGVIEKVLTNVPGPSDHDAVEFSEDISRFLEFAKEEGEKLAIFDEFSTSGNAYTGQQEVEQVMSRCINAFRKSEGGSLRTLYIGHTNDNDIHPLVKEQSDVVIRADGKKEEGLIDKATIFDSWDDYKAGDDSFAVRGLQDVPDGSEWSFDTNYFAHLEWDLDQPDKQIQRGELIEGWEAFQNDSSAETSSDAEKSRCRGQSKDGSRCGTVDGLDSEGFCRHHGPDDVHPDAPEEPSS